MENSPSTEPKQAIEGTSLSRAKLPVPPGENSQPQGAKLPDSPRAKENEGLARLEALRTLQESMSSQLKGYEKALEGTTNPELRENLERTYESLSKRVKALELASEKLASQSEASTGEEVGSLKKAPERSQKHKIVLDAGHGGKDSGARAGEVWESREALKYTMLLKKELESRGHQVVLTRESDETLCLESRACMSDGESPDAFLSLHLNHYKRKTVGGHEVCYETAEDQSLAVAVDEALDPVAKAQGLKTTRDTKHRPDLKVLNSTNNSYPSILVEFGFMSHSKDLKSMLDEGYRQKQVVAVADALCQELSAKKARSEFVSGENLTKNG